MSSLSADDDKQTLEQEELDDHKHSYALEDVAALSRAPSPEASVSSPLADDDKQTLLYSQARVHDRAQGALAPPSDSDTSDPSELP